MQSATSSPMRPRATPASKPCRKARRRKCVSRLEISDTQSQPAQPAPVLDLLTQVKPTSETCAPPAELGLLTTPRRDQQAWPAGMDALKPAASSLPQPTAGANPSANSIALLTQLVSVIQAAQQPQPANPLTQISTALKPSAPAAQRFAVVPP